MAENTVASQEQENELQSLRAQVAAQERLILQMAGELQEITRRLKDLSESHERLGNKALQMAQILESMQ